MDTIINSVLCNKNFILCNNTNYDFLHRDSQVVCIQNGKNRPCYNTIRSRDLSFGRVRQCLLPCCAVKTTWFHLYSITTVDLTGSYRFLRSVAPLSQCLTRRRAGLL